METLTAYVREHSPRKDPDPPLPVATDIQAILTVIGRRNTAFDDPSQRLNLFGADLFGADLFGAYLAGANLDAANLANATLVNANLAGANISAARFDGAKALKSDNEGD